MPRGQVGRLSENPRVPEHPATDEHAGNGSHAVDNLLRFDAVATAEHRNGELFGHTRHQVPVREAGV